MFGPGRVLPELVRKVRNVRVVLNAGGGTYVKKLPHHFIHQDFGSIRPTEGQISSKRWLRRNGWRKRK